MSNANVKKLILSIEISGQKQAVELAERRALERELAKVSIKKEDVDLVNIKKKLFRIKNVTFILFEHISFWAFKKCFLKLFLFFSDRRRNGDLEDKGGTDAERTSGKRGRSSGIADQLISFRIKFFSYWKFFLLRRIKTLKNLFFQPITFYYEI